MTQHTEQRSEVLVVGAGPVGLVMASELTRHGTHCRIVDKAPSPASTSRALAIFPRTLEVFENIGVVEAVLRAGHKLYGFNIYAESRLLAHLGIDELESPYPFVIILPQSETERILLTHLAQMRVSVERPVELLSHVRWYGKYHRVFVPKYRRRVIYGQLRRRIGPLLWERCQQQGMEWVAGHAMPNHVPLCLSIPPQ